MMNSQQESNELIALKISKDRFTDDFQNDCANAILRVFCFVGPPLSVFLVYRILTGSLPEFFWAAVFFVLVLTVVGFAQKQFSVTQKAMILMVPMLLICILLVSNQGLYSQGILTIVILIALSSVYQKRATQPILAVFVICLITYAGSLHLTERVLINELSSKQVVYIRMFTTLSLLLIIGVLIRTLVNTLYRKSELLMVANIQYQKVAADLNSTLEELTLLRKTINVCAKCKKVRRNIDDDGSESWYSLEEYIHEHTDANVSHGYCQVCFDEEMAYLC
ncbi:MAG: hypothetical protein ACI9FB_000535 [Candidatus Azotimanducaceae bacterium]|jgi:hypothetical protein